MTTDTLTGVSARAVPLRHLISNALAFQIVWLACALGARFGVPWVGTGSALLIVALHLASARRPGGELTLLAAAATVGIAWDSAWQTAGWIGFAAGDWIPGLAPHWMVALWVAFATTLNVSMRWLHGRWGLCAVFGALGGPISYYAGERLAALAFSDVLFGLAGQALGWALLTPLLVWLAMRLDGIAPATRPD